MSQLNPGAVRNGPLFMKKHFNARWYAADNGGQIGNVSFFARSVSEAIRKADKIGKDIGLPRSERSIEEGYREVHRKPYTEIYQ